MIRTLAVCINAGVEKRNGSSVLIARRVGSELARPTLIKKEEEKYV